MNVNVVDGKKQEFNGITYYLCDKYYQKNGVRLHRMVWQYHNGLIPQGFHVHHVDGNRNNNDISNLELKDAKKHISEHGKEPARQEYLIRHIADIRVLASEWHKSTEGRKWHSKQAKINWQNKVLIKYKCTHCGKEFSTLKEYSKASNTFCSNNCKAAYRRESGVDNETRACGYCNKEYSVNKYSKTKTCSSECGVKLRWKRES